MAVPAEQITKLLEVLSQSGVEFIVIGGAAGVLHGAPVTTLDLDIVHRRTPENIAKLLDVLRQLGVYFHHRRLRSGRRLAVPLGAGPH
ncbi:MAG: hypothetical protein JNJ46_31400 [Myxococcales bacterium]|nr:hypothetical protein [Myxococcales bacterium]